MPATVRSFTRWPLLEKLLTFSRSGRIPSFIAVAAYLFLALTILDLPRQPYNASHDLSSHATFEYYSAHHLQYGKDIYQNVGPYGYIHYAETYSGLLNTRKILFRLLSRLGLLLLVIWINRYLPSSWMKICWWTLFVVFLPITDTQNPLPHTLIAGYLDWAQVFAALTIYLGALFLFQPRNVPLFRSLSFCVILLLAFLALTKHTCFVMATAAICAVSCQRLFRWQLRPPKEESRKTSDPPDSTAITNTEKPSILDPPKAETPFARDFGLSRLIAVISPLVIYAALIVALWVDAAQHPLNLPSYIRGIVLFSSGYNEAMALSPTPANLVLGLVVLALLLARTAYNFLVLKQGAGRSLLELSLLYVAWKHGFVRADAEHLMTYFFETSFFSILFSLAILAPPETAKAPNVGQASRPPPNPLRPLSSVPCPLSSVLAVLSTLLSLSGIWWNSDNYGYRLGHIPERITNNLSWIFSPQKTTAKLDAQLNEVARAWDLPRIKATVHEARVDSFGNNPGPVLLNRLNYSPRPMPVAIGACNETLQRANEAFYRDPRTAPDYVICYLGVVDERAIVQQDALALRALLDDYHPLLIEKGHVLLGRNKAAGAPNSVSARPSVEDHNHQGGPMHLATPTAADDSPSDYNPDLSGLREGEGAEGERVGVRIPRTLPHIEPPNVPLQDKRSAILPLPFGRGEGRGEGSFPGEPFMVRGTSEAVTKPVPFLNSTIPFAAQVSLTQSNTPIWMEVEIRHSWLGKLLSFLYQAPDCYLSLSAPGRPVSYFKFVTTVGGTGCLLSPYIFNKYDLLQFYLGDASPDRMTIPESFSFLTRPGDQKFFSNDIRLRLYPAAKPIVTGPTDRSLEAALAKMLGDTLAANGKMDEALVQYTNALQLEPDFADACFSLGATLLRIGRAQDALPHLNKAFELQPTDRFSQPMLHYLLGEALSSAGQPRAAIDHFSRALEVQPDLLTACNSLAWLLATCQDDALRNGHRAVALARRAVRLSHGNNPAFMATLAAAYAETGRFEQAQETAQRAILLALDQNNSDLASNLQRQLDLYRMNSPCRSY